MSGYDEKNSKEGTGASTPGADHFDTRPESLTPKDPDVVPRDRLNALFENPLKNKTYDELMKDVSEFCERFGLMNHLDDFKKGAL